MSQVFWHTISVAGVNAGQDSQANLWGMIQAVVANPNLPVTATIVPELDNPHDPGALRVELNGQKIGYIARKDQGEFKRVFPGFPAKPVRGKVEGWGVHKENQLFCQVSFPINA